MASIQVTDHKESRTKSNATKFIVQESLPKGRYINPLTDFGFKRIFGEENMELLIN